MSTRSQLVARGRDAERAAPRGGVKVTARAAVLLVIVMLLAIALYYPVHLYAQQRGQIATLQHQTDMLTKQNESLTKEVSKLRDPLYLQELARECLGMVKPGESLFVVVPRGGAPKPAAC